MNLDDEPNLVEASRSGEAEAFAKLVARYQTMIHALTYRMCGSDADASDLAQDTFVVAWNRIDQFRGESRFSSWLYRIAMNLCLNWRARLARESQAKLELSQQQCDDSRSPEDARTRHLQAALMQLPPKQRAAIVLTVYDELTHGEAAEILGCSETTISWRIFSARRKLKRAIETAARNERLKS